MKNHILNKLKSKLFKRAFTIVELVIVIIVIGILFVAFTSKTDNTTEKAKVAGVQADFREFYTATKTVGLESQLWLLSEEEFEKKLNDNLDIPLQFTNGVSAEKDPWNENYVYKFRKDVVNQTAYVMFASKGDKDVYHLSIEDVVKAYGSDFYKITMGFKQYQTLFSAMDTDALVDAEVYEEMHDDINLTFGGVDTSNGLKYGSKYKYDYAGEQIVRIFYKNGLSETFIDGEQVSTDGTKFKYRDNKDGTTTIYTSGVFGTEFGICSADGTEIELAYGVTAYLMAEGEPDPGEPGYELAFKWKPSDGYEAVAGTSNAAKLGDFYLTKAQIDAGVRIKYTAPNGGVLTQDGLGFMYDGYTSNFLHANVWKVPNDLGWSTETGFYALTTAGVSIGGETYNPLQVTVEVYTKKTETPANPSLPEEVSEGTLVNISTYRWAELSAISAEVQAGRKTPADYGIDVASMTKDQLTKDGFTLVDMGTDPDDSYDGFVFMGDICDESVMHSLGTNNGGYNSSEIKTKLEAYYNGDTTLGTINPEIKTVIKPVDIVSNTGSLEYQSGIYSHISEGVHLFLPSLKELGVDYSSYFHTEGYDLEGNIFDYYKNESGFSGDHYAVQIGYSWVRSAWSSDNARYIFVDTDGTSSRYDAHDTNRVCPCFVI